MKEPLRILIAVVTCHKLRARADAQRETWVPLVRGADVRFFVGRGDCDEARPDEVALDVADDYKSLPYKTRAMFRWALDHAFTHVFKTDDDVYIEPARLLKSGFENHDYSGRRSTGVSKFPYASGFGYWVSRLAMERLAAAEVDGWAEDRWTGNVLADAGIQLHVDSRYVVVNALRPRNEISSTEGPQDTNAVIAACEFEPEAMRRIHASCFPTYFSRGVNEATMQAKLQLEVER